MTRRPGFGGGSLGVRLLALIVVPMVALGVLGFQRVDVERNNAASAREIVDDAELQRAIAAVLAPAQLEQIALEGLARIDELGIEREIIVNFAGVNLEQIYSTNLIEFERVLDELAAGHGDLVLSDGEELGERLSFVRGRLQTQRALSDEFRARPDKVRTTFDQLDETLVFALATTRPVAESGHGTVSMSLDERARLRSLGDVLTTAGLRGQAMLTGLVDRTNQNSLDLVAASARLEVAMDNYCSLLSESEQVEFNAVAAELEPIPKTLLAVVSEDSVGDATNPDVVEASAKTLLDQLHFLEVLENYSTKSHAIAVAMLEGQAAAAENTVVRMQVIVFGTGLASLMLLMLVGLSVLRPLRRLTRRAHAIGQGELDNPSLELRGPRDVRTLTASMNQMLATLQDVDTQLARLANGAGTAMATPPPGAIGVSLRKSFEHLESMTSQLHASEELASAIVEQAADAIWTVDELGHIRSANAASEQLTGIDAHAQIGQPISAFLSTLDGEASLRSSQSLALRYHVTSTEIDGGVERRTAIVAHDITERLRFEERLAHQASHDALTGLPNRFALLDHIEELPADERVALLFVDLDGFKTVNDVQGHLAGDRVLAEVATRLSATIRPADFVGRLGGDEFVVIVRDFDQLADVVAFGYRLIHEIEQPYGNGSEVFAISASVGVATYDQAPRVDALSALDAIRQADSAVYLAKRRGRGRVEIFDRQLQDALIRDADLEIALRSAIKNDELILHLQPVMNLATGQFTSAEALVRWNRPGFGMVPPGDFIPVAEKSSLISAIDRWVLTTACRTLASWRLRDPECAIRIAVNVAGRHLVDGGLVADLEAALSLTGADPRLLEFELTETQLLEDLDRASAVLDEVRTHGVTIAIDDFGTGYSSMAYLQKLPLDTLKIDRSFIMGIAGAGFDATVLQALLTIGASLGVSVVAEGIETDQQLAYLQAHGCDRGQGFLLARPMPIVDAEIVLGTTSVIDAGVDTVDPVGAGLLVH